jgi:NitT/TauT family transport system substrate-binding protein
MPGPDIIIAIRMGFRLWTPCRFVNLDVDAARPQRLCWRKGGGLSGHPPPERAGRNAVSHLKLLVCGLFALVAQLIAQAAVAAAQSPADKPELAEVRLAVGGKPALYYLPVTVTERLGYFKDSGIDVEISDFPGGARALQSLMGGSADMVNGAFDHTIQMQAKNQPITALVLLGQSPGYALGIPSAKADSYKGPQDLKGMKIGVTAPGSSSQFMVQHMMVKAGLKPDDASFIGVGATTTAAAAVRRGEIDAIVNTDPVISLLAGEKAIKIVAGTRSTEGSRQVYGGSYPAAILYAQPAFIEKNPKTVQAMVNAYVRGLRWIAAHNADEIAAIMPEEYMLGDKALYIQSVKNNKPLYSPDGRFSRDGAETGYAVLKEFDKEVAAAKIDLNSTYTNAFVDKVPR